MSLLLAKNVVTLAEVEAIKTPEATEKHFPIPHSLLIEQVRAALLAQGFTIVEEEHALASKGARYFGGFAVTSPDVAGERRQLVVGIRNAHDKSFAAAIVLGNRMMVCDNLCFSSEVKLGRKHTRHIERDLPNVIAKAVARLTQSWLTMGQRIEAYERTEISEQEAYSALVHLVDVKALTSQKLYAATELFRNPALAALGMVVKPELVDGGMTDEEIQESYQTELSEKKAQLGAEFGSGTLWTLYNAFTECLKGGDLSKLPVRTMIAQSYFDALAKFSPVVREDLEEVDVEPSEQEENFQESFSDEDQQVEGAETLQDWMD